MGDIWRDEECFTFTDEMIHDPIAFVDANFDVALQLVKIFFRIDEMKIVPRVGPLDHHDEKITAIVKVTVADWRLEEVTVFFDPVIQIDRWLDSGHGRALCG